LVAPLRAAAPGLLVPGELRLVHTLRRVKNKERTLRKKEKKRKLAVKIDFGKCSAPARICMITHTHMGFPPYHPILMGKLHSHILITFHVSGEKDQTPQNSYEMTRSISHHLQCKDHCDSVGVGGHKPIFHPSPEKKTDRDCWRGGRRTVISRCKEKSARGCITN